MRCLEALIAILVLTRPARRRSEGILKGDFFEVIFLGRACCLDMKQQRGLPAPLEQILFAVVPKCYRNAVSASFD